MRHAVIQPERIQPLNAIERQGGRSERSLLEKVRYMAAPGLERKCNIKACIQKVEHLRKKGIPYNNRPD